MMVSIGQRLVADIRAELFAHIQTLSMAYHDRHRVGDLMSRVSNDTEAINRVLSNGLVAFSSNILLLFGIMVAMFLQPRKKRNILRKKRMTMEPKGIARRWSWPPEDCFQLLRVRIRKRSPMRSEPVLIVQKRMRQKTRPIRPPIMNQVIM